MKEKVEEKIWGIYNTFENPEMIDTLEEIDLWKKIDNLGGMIFYAMHDYNKSWTKDVKMKDIIEAQYNLEYLVYSTRRFGVEFSQEPSANEHILRSESYNAWFRFWYNHFNNMPKEIYDQFVSDKLNGKDISKYLPSSNWQSSIRVK